MDEVASRHVCSFASLEQPAAWDPAARMRALAGPDRLLPLDTDLAAGP